LLRRSKKPPAFASLKQKTVRLKRLKSKSAATHSDIVSSQQKKSHFCFIEAKNGSCKYKKEKDMSDRAGRRLARDSSETSSVGNAATDNGGAARQGRWCYKPVRQHYHLVEAVLQGVGIDATIVQYCCFNCFPIL
jgi:hypothetical protein